MLGAREPDFAVHKKQPAAESLKKCFQYLFALCAVLGHENSCLAHRISEFNVLYNILGSGVVGFWGLIGID